MIFFFCSTFKLLKHLQPPANLKPPRTSEGEQGIGLMKVSTELQYSGANKCDVFLTKTMH